MSDKELIKSLGFEELKENVYTIIVNEMYLLLYTDSTVYDFVLNCSPAKGELDFEIDNFLREKTRNSTCIFVSYTVGKLELKYNISSDEYNKINLQTAVELVRETIEKFDLLPSCSICRRNCALQIYFYENNIHTVCDVCKGEIELRKKHENIIAESRVQSTDRNKSTEETRPLDDTLIAGIKGGAIGAAAAIILTILGTVIRFLGMIPWVPGAIAGFYTMHKVCSIDYLNTAFKTLIAGAMSLAVMFSISLIGVTLFCAVTGMNAGYVLSSFFSGLAGLLTLALGIGGFLLGMAARYFTY